MHILLRYTYQLVHLFAKKYLIMLLLSFAITLNAKPLIHELYIIIPGPIGGGWDTTARLVGDALADTGLIEKPTYHNYKGAGRWRGFEKFISDPHLKMESWFNPLPLFLESYLVYIEKATKI